MVIRTEKELEHAILNEIDRVLDDIADMIFQKSQENLVNMGAIDTGFLLRSGNVERDFLAKKIVYSAPYSIIVEFGRQPGSMPPITVIQEWVRRKLGIQNPKKAESIAWAIAQSIKTNGIEPRPFMRNAINSISASMSSK